MAYTDYISYIGEESTPATLTNGITNTSRILKYYVSDWILGGAPLSLYSMDQVPVEKSQHPVDSTLLVESINVSNVQEGDRLTGNIFVTVNYTNNSNAFGAGTAVNVARSNEPWNDPPYNWSVTPYEMPRALTKTYDTNDAQFGPTKDFVNSAKDPLSAETFDILPLLSFSYNLRQFDIDWVRRFTNTINKNQVTVTDCKIPAKHGLIKRLAPSQEIVYDSDGDIDYYYDRVDVEILVFNAEIKLEVIDQGFNLYSGDKKYRIYTDDKGNFGKFEDITNGSPIDTPARLDGAGGIATGDEVNYLTFQDKFAANWSTLSLPKIRRAK